MAHVPSGAWLPGRWHYGSIGKTTTKDVLAAVLAKRYRVWATKGNFNNLFGMPIAVLSAPADTEVLVLEMGMNHFTRSSACPSPPIPTLPS